MPVLKVDSGAQENHRGKEEKVDKDRNAGQLRSSTVHCLLLMLRASHSDGVDAEEDRRNQRVDRINHVACFQVLSAQLVRSNVVIPDLVRDQNRQSHEE